MNRQQYPRKAAVLASSSRRRRYANFVSFSRSNCSLARHGQRVFKMAAVNKGIAIAQHGLLMEYRHCWHVNQVDVELLQYFKRKSLNAATNTMTFQGWMVSTCCVYLLVGELSAGAGVYKLEQFIRLRKWQKCVKVPIGLWRGRLKINSGFPPTMQQMTRGCCSIYHPSRGYAGKFTFQT
uniref:Uncharacterized protein n=1 Tax=Trichuris muris TaxID=70415 RepID=A0A5S6R679_TRIMR